MTTKPRTLVSTRPCLVLGWCSPVGQDHWLVNEGWATTQRSITISIKILNRWMDEQCDNSTELYKLKWMEDPHKERLYRRWVTLDTQHEIHWLPVGQAIYCLTLWSSRCFTGVGFGEWCPILSKDGVWGLWNFSLEMVPFGALHVCL